MEHFEIENTDMTIMDFFQIYDDLESKTSAIDEIVKTTVKIYISRHIFYKSVEQIISNLSQHGDIFEDHVNSFFNK